MDKSTILQIIGDWQTHILQIQGIKRDYENSLWNAIGSKPIKIVTGFRRSGKSFLIQRVAGKLVSENKIPISSILYLNFEDFRLAGFNTPEKVFDIYKIFRSDIAGKGKKLIIFDEIQKVRKWDRFVRTLFERDHDIEIILSGSNSELLSSEIGSNLAGRFVEFSILPFDFKEYMAWQGKTVRNTNEFYRKSEEIAYHFSNYTKFGGLPESLTITEEHACFSYLEGIVSKVILDDVINRFNIKQTAVVEKIVYYLLSAIGNNVSFSRISNYLKQLGIEIKQETIIHYVQYILKTFALYEINKFDWKLGRIFSTVRKYYAVDTGLVNLCRNTGGNYSRLLENIVYLKLKRRGNVIYYGSLSSGKEIDFISKTGEGNFEKYQITQTLHHNNFDREMAPFAMTGKFMEEGRNHLLSLDPEEGEIDYNGQKVFRKNIVKWLLDL